MIVNGKVGRAYRVGGVPKLVLIDKDGKVKRSTTGWTNEDVLCGLDGCR